MTINLLQLLLEVSTEDLQKRWVDSGKMSQEQFDTVKKASNNKSSWVTWLGVKVLNRLISLKEGDVDKWQRTIKTFDRYKQRFPIKDIHQIKTKEQIDQFIKTALDLEAQVNQKDKATKAAKDQFSEFYKGTVKADGKTFKVYVLPKGHPENYDVSRKLGGDSKWCTAGSDPSPFKRYTSKSDLVIFINESDPKEKYQLCVESNELNNRGNEHIGWSSRLARDLCQEALKKGIIKKLPPDLQKTLEWEKGLPSEKDAPKLDSFKVYDKDGAQVYLIENFNLKDHYRAFKDLIGMGPNVPRNPLSGGNYLYISYEDDNSLICLRDNRGGYVFRGKDLERFNMVQAVYDMFVFLKKRYQIPVPENFVISFDNSVLDPETFLVESFSEGKLYKLTEKQFNSEASSKFKTSFGIHRPLYPVSSDYYLFAPAEYPRKYLKGYFDDENVLQLGTVSGVSSSFKRFFLELLKKRNFIKSSNEIFLHRYDFSDLDLLDVLYKDHKKPSYENFDNIFVFEEGSDGYQNFFNGDRNNGTLIAFTLGKNSEINYCNSSTFFIEGSYTRAHVNSLGEKNVNTLLDLLNKYGIECAELNKAVETYFPKLLGKERIEEELNVPKIPNLLRLSAQKGLLQPVSTVLFRRPSTGRSIKLEKEDVLKTTWGKVKYSFKKSISSEWYEKINSVCNDNAVVYLYMHDFYNAWNCRILVKDGNGNLTYYITRQGTDMGTTYKIEKIKQNMQESFDPIQKARLQFLAGIK